jgi:hypothetical protein
VTSAGALGDGSPRRAGRKQPHEIDPWRRGSMIS